MYRITNNLRKLTDSEIEPVKFFDDDDSKICYYTIKKELDNNKPNENEIVIFNNNIYIIIKNKECLVLYPLDTNKFYFNYLFELLGLSEKHIDNIKKKTTTNFNEE